MLIFVGTLTFTAKQTASITLKMKNQEGEIKLQKAIDFQFKSLLLLFFFIMLYVHVPGKKKVTVSYCILLYHISKEIGKLLGNL